MSRPLEGKSLRKSSVTGMIISPRSQNDKNWGETAVRERGKRGGGYRRCVVSGPEEPGSRLPRARERAQQRGDLKRPRGILLQGHGDYVSSGYAKMPRKSCNARRRERESG